MSLRRLAPVAALAVLAVAAPAAAQSSFSHSTGGWSVNLPASMAVHPFGAENGDKGQFVVRRGGTDVGICVASAQVPQGGPVTQEVWTQVANTYNNNPAGEARGAAERAGHTFLRHLGSRPFTSRAGWTGYFFWYERTNGATKNNQTAVNAASMLSPTSRFVAVCTSSAGYFFDNNDINAIHSFVASARAG
ncbi:MAG TPA: hypothetical protein VEA44_13755 [Caulobacter sp.]|nr:hypothetical protein [Caulobacter sp.]